MAPDKLLVMHIVGLHECRRMNCCKMSWFAEAGWHVGRRSRNYGCTGLRNRVLVQWLSTSLTVKGLFSSLPPVQSMRLCCLLPKSCAKWGTGSSKYLSRFGQGSRISLSGGGSSLRQPLKSIQGAGTVRIHVRHSIRPSKRKQVGRFRPPLSLLFVWEQQGTLSPSFLWDREQVPQGWC